MKRLALSCLAIVVSCSVYTEDLLLPFDPLPGVGGGGGTGVTCDAAVDCPGEDSECSTRTCLDGVCGEALAPSGTACMGDMICDGEGACVECVGDGDCEGADVCDVAANLCVPATCVNGTRDEAETDVDCGGPDCAPCPDGDGCAVASDCTSGVCTAMVCQAPECGDGIVNGGEACDGDGMGNGGETESCDADCTPQLCGDGVVNVTAGEACDGDGMGSGGETAICDPDCSVAECGDGTLNTTAGEACDDGDQDNTDACPDGPGGTCQSASCGDGFVQSGSESCDDGDAVLNDDCPSGPNGPCAPASCSDGFLHDQGSGTETDVDCGGSCLGCPGPLLIHEIQVGLTDAEFIEIHNPTASAIHLGNVYLADLPTYYLVTQGAVSTGASDFVARFPAGTSIAAGGYVTVSIQGASLFNAAQGQLPDFDLDPGDAARPSLLGNIGGSAGLTNASEVVVLFFWDGTSDLVEDLDYVFYGSTLTNAADKTGTTVGASTYLADTAPGAQAQAAAPPNGSSLQRCSLAETGEATLGGNGYLAHDETSEATDVTFVVSPSPTPGQPNGCP